MVFFVEPNNWCLQHLIVVIKSENIYSNANCFNED